MTTDHQQTTEDVLAKLRCTDGVMGSPTFRHYLDMAITEIERQNAIIAEYNHLGWKERSSKMATDQNTTTGMVAGERVRLSSQGIQQLHKRSPARLGTILRVRFDGKVIVLWDGNKKRKCDTPWSPDFLSVVKEQP